MFDRETATTCNHFDGKAIKKPLDGVRMGLVPLEMLTFGEWKRGHPDALAWYGWADFHPQTEILGTSTDWTEVKGLPTGQFGF